MSFLFIFNFFLVLWGGKVGVKFIFKHAYEQEQNDKWYLEHRDNSSKWKTNVASLQNFENPCSDCIISSIHAILWKVGKKKGHLIFSDFFR